MARKPKTYYAVRVGRRPGVYDSWPAAQAQLKGFPRASVSKHRSVEEARAAFEGTNTVAAAEAAANAADATKVWTDGSQRGKLMAYGACWAGGELCGPGKRTLAAEFGAGVAGAKASSSLAEMCGAVAALRALPPGLRVVLYVDNDGVRQWWNGGWTARTPGIAAMLAAMRREAARHASVHVMPVDAHTGVPENERADALAELGYRLRTDGFVPDISAARRAP